MNKKRKETEFHFIETHESCFRLFQVTYLGNLGMADVLGTRHGNLARLQMREVQIANEIRWNDTV